MPRPNHQPSHQAIGESTYELTGPVGSSSLFGFAVLPLYLPSKVQATSIVTVYLDIPNRLFSSTTQVFSTSRPLKPLTQAYTWCSSIISTIQPPQTYTPSTEAIPKPFSSPPRPNPDSAGSRPDGIMHHLALCPWHRFSPTRFHRVGCRCRAKGCCLLRM